MSARRLLPESPSHESGETGAARSLQTRVLSALSHQDRANQPSVIEETSASLLTAADVDRIAERTAELILGAQRTLPPARLIDAAGVADMLGVERDFVYDHADELGALRIGHGSKSRLRFDPQVVRERLTARCVSERSQTSNSPVSAGRRRGRPRAGSGTDVPLLPLRAPEVPR